MLKLAYRYDQSAARLMVEGLPDISADHGPNVIGILSSWKLQFVGSPELEGKREHLEAMLGTVLPYARYLLSSAARRVGDSGSPVSIVPIPSGGHQLELRSSQPGVEPLAIALDDAELADLVRCLDAMRLDDRVQIAWPQLVNAPLPRRELSERVPLIKRLAAPALGGTALVVIAFVAALLPIPELNKPTSDADASQSSSVPSENASPSSNQESSASASR